MHLTKRVTALYIASGLALTIAIGATMHTRTARARVVVVEGPPLASFARPGSDADMRDGDIAFYTARVREDQQSAVDRVALAALLLARSRSTASVSDLARAESLARESIALRARRNGQAHEILASALMARHAFAEAYRVTRLADSLEPHTPSHLALLGEIALELGDYAAADRHFKAVHYDGEQFTIGSRVARWYELTGHADLARRVLARAILHVDRRDDLPREQAAWFHYRLGELEMRLGNLAAADSALLGALQRNPDDARALGGLTRTALARSDWYRAIAYGERATAVQLDPTTLGAVSRAYSALNDSAQAARFAAAMSVSALSDPRVMHRAWGLFLLDHGSHRERVEVLRRARREMRERRDVYGHDLLAWALFRTGHVDEAQREMQLALAQHTEDVQLVAHAREIAAGRPSGNLAP